MKTCTINGKKRENLSSDTVTELLAELDLGSRKVAVMINNEIVKKDQRAKSKVNDGDQIEIISMVGGG